MQKNIKLTREQVFFLSFIGTIGNIVYSHTWIDDNTDRSAWVATFLGILLIIPFAIWIFYLGKFYPKGTIFDIVEAGLGKLTSKFLSILFILINIVVAAAQLNMFTQMLNVFFLQHTPSWVIMLFLILICTMFVYGGINVFGRLTEILGILGLLNYFAAFVFAFPKFFNTQYVFPIFDTSLWGFIKGTIYMTGGAAECLLILMIIVRYVPEPAKHYWWVITGIAFSAVIFSLAIFVIIGMLSPEMAKRIGFGGVNAAKVIQIGNYIQGLEVFIFGTYQFIATGKITLSMYCAWISAKKIFNGKMPLLLLFITALIFTVPSLYLSSYRWGYYLAVLLANYVLLPFSVFILLLASISAFIIKKRVGRVK